MRTIRFGLSMSSVRRTRMRGIGSPPLEVRSKPDRARIGDGSRRRSAWWSSVLPRPLGDSVGSSSPSLSSLFVTGGGGDAGDREGRPAVPPGRPDAISSTFRSRSTSTMTVKAGPRAGACHASRSLSRWLARRASTPLSRHPRRSDTSPTCQRRDIASDRAANHRVGQRSPSDLLLDRLSEKVGTSTRSAGAVAGLSQRLTGVEQPRSPWRS